MKTKPAEHPMKFKTSETYEIVTPESAENGEADETGFIFQDEYYTFRELVRLMIGAGYYHPSEAPTISERTWFSTDKYNEDFSTGAVENRSIHIEMSARNKVRLAKAVGISGYRRRP